MKCAGLSELSDFFIEPRDHDLTKYVEDLLLGPIITITDGLERDLFQ